MNRRDFLKAITAVPVAAFVPAWVQPLPQWGISIAEITAVVQKLKNAVAEDYVAFLHPSCWFDLRRLRAMEEWRRQYRQWRVARREFGIVEPLEAVMARVKKSVEAEEVMDMREGLAHAFTHGEVGSYQGFRMIASDKVA